MLLLAGECGVQRDDPRALLVLPAHHLVPLQLLEHGGDLSHAGQEDQDGAVFWELWGLEECVHYTEV